MNSFVVTAMLAGLAVTVAGLVVQLLGHMLFVRFGDDDTKDVAGVVGFRVSAIFGIAVGLIFAASAAYLIEAKRNLQEEARLIGTLQFLAAEAPTLVNRGKVQQNLTEFAERSMRELDAEVGPDSAGRVTSNLLIESCRGMAPADADTDEVRWTKAEFQRSCSMLIDLRGKKLIGSREGLVSKPFWVFFGICFGFLAFLFGVFALTPINVVFASVFYFTTGITGAIIYAAGNPYQEPGKVESSPLMEALQNAGSTNSSSNGSR